MLQFYSSDYCTAKENGERKFTRKSDYVVVAVVSAVVISMFCITIPLMYYWCVSKISGILTNVVTS